MEGEDFLKNKFSEIDLKGKVRSLRFNLGRGVVGVGLRGKIIARAWILDLCHGYLGNNTRFCRENALCQCWNECRGRMLLEISLGICPFHTPAVRGRSYEQK